MQKSLFILISLVVSLNAQGLNFSPTTMVLSERYLYNSTFCPHLNSFNISLCGNFTDKYRTYDGSCNNKLRPWVGQTLSPYKHYRTQQYQDGISTPRRMAFTNNNIQMPHPRNVSRQLCDDIKQTDPLWTHLLPLFGQFVVHDLVFTLLAPENGIPGTIKSCPCSNNQSQDCISVNVSAIDNNMNQQCMQMTRSVSANDFLNCNYTVREQVNGISSFLDASNIYGSTVAENRELRTFIKGQMKTSNGIKSGCPYMPTSNATGSKLFVGGDVRASENMGLSAIHTLFLREHNRIASELANINSTWNDETLFQETRRIVNAILANIVYNEYIQEIISTEYARRLGLPNKPINTYYPGYKPNWNAAISSEFATAAFRLHTNVRNEIHRFNDKQRQIDRCLPLESILGNTKPAYENQGLESIMAGMLIEPMYPFDLSLSDAVQNKLVDFLPSPTKIDMATANIMRGREHGIQSYSKYRDRYSIFQNVSVKNYRDFVKDDNYDKLISVYKNIHDVELYIGGLSEVPLDNGVVGPTFAAIIGYQFRDLKSADRFYFENPGVFKMNQLNEIKKQKLSGLICNNFDITKIQRNPFLLSNLPGNDLVDCSDNAFKPINLDLWKQL